MIVGFVFFALINFISITTGYHEERCFGEYNVKMPVNISVQLKCASVENDISIIDVRYLRPSYTGDQDCIGGRSSTNKCCTFSDASVCQSSGGQIFQNVSEMCNQKNNCSIILEPSDMSSSCNNSCRSYSTEPNRKWLCWSRKISILYGCYKEGDCESNEVTTQATSKPSSVPSECTPHACQCDKTPSAEPCSTSAPNQCTPCVCNSNTKQTTVKTTDIPSAETTTNLKTHQDTESSEAMIISSSSTSKDEGNVKSEAQVEKDDEKSEKNSTAIIIVLALLIPVSFVGGLLAHILYSRCNGTTFPGKMKSRRTSVYKINDLGDKRMNQTNHYYPGDSSKMNTMVDEMYYDADPTSDAMGSGNCVDTPELEDEYVVMCDQEDIANLKKQSLDIAGKLNENPYCEGFQNILPPMDGNRKVVKGDACIKVVEVPKCDGEMEDNPYYEGTGDLTTTGNEKGPNQPKITNNLKQCASNNIKMSANGNYHPALPEQKVAVEDVEMADNPYYDGTGELDHKTPTQLSEKKVPYGDDKELTDNPYYDGSGNLEVSNMERPNQNAKGKDKERNYVYTYGHFKLEGREREEK